jgi:hypothetical protein
MTLSFEVLLIIGVLGFYLYDSAILLFSNELVFIESYGRWSFSFPNPRWLLRGRVLYFPNPLAPYKMIYRAAWSTNDNALEIQSEDLTHKFSAPLCYLRILVIVLMILLVVVLPVVMLRLGAGVVFLVVLFLIYFTILNMLGYIFIKKVNLQLTNKAFLSLAFDSLACPPFAINMLRKISLRMQICNNPVEFSRLILKPNDFKKFAATLIDKLAEELDFEDELDSQRSNELINYREKILGISI